MLSSPILFTKTLFQCSEDNKINFIDTYRKLSRNDLLQILINEIGMRNGELRIKVQNGCFVVIEVMEKIRSDKEGLFKLENIHL